jgi:hypothetical protein
MFLAVSQQAVVPAYFVTVDNYVHKKPLNIGYCDIIMSNL